MCEFVVRDRERCRAMDNLLQTDIPSTTKAPTTRMTLARGSTPQHVPHCTFTKNLQEQNMSNQPTTDAA